MTTTIEEDSQLWTCNETELLEIIRREGVGRLRRGLDKGLLVSIAGGYSEPLPEHFSSTNYTRKKLQEHIWAQIERLRHQLPGCTGVCTQYNCTDGRHGLCFLPNEVSVS
jgi:hypothetical protein